MQVVRVRGDDALEGAHGPVQLRRRQRPGEFQQLLLTIRVGDSRQRAHLRIRQLTACESRTNERKLRELAGDTDVLARCPRQ
jgi:hypothetical protein